MVSWFWWHFPAATGTGSAIATDVLGNVYFLGSFSDSVDFDSSPSSTILVSNPIGSDLYISKYDSSSNLIWAKQITGLGSCYGTEIMVEGDHLCISGYFSGSFDFDPTVNDSVITSNGIDVFIAKYDTIGNFKWVRSIGGPTNSDKANGLAVDSLCNFYVTGVFEGTVDFNPDTNINNLSPISSTGRDLFVAKYDSSGNYVWAFNINSTYGAVGRGLITDVSGIIVTAFYRHCRF
ncbi:MAG: SBBP repeat-containing protein [Bacteroidetes bacterium]|nr:SBBP repeat-containing protein [Bacteroidota bacterium]